MEKKPIFAFGTTTKNCQVQVIETSPRAIAKVVRAEILLSSVLDSCKKITKGEDGTETKSYSIFNFKTEILEKLEHDVLPILTDLVSGFEA